jgi:hypothetical protein
MKLPCHCVGGDVTHKSLIFRADAFTRPRFLQFLHGYNGLSGRDLSLSGYLKEK